MQKAEFTSIVTERSQLVPSYYRLILATEYFIIHRVYQRKRRNVGILSPQ